MKLKITENTAYIKKKIKKKKKRIAELMWCNFPRIEGKLFFLNMLVVMLHYPNACLILVFNTCITIIWSELPKLTLLNYWNFSTLTNHICIMIIWILLYYYSINFQQKGMIVMRRKHIYLWTTFMDQSSFFFKLIWWLSLAFDHLMWVMFALSSSNTGFLDNLKEKRRNMYSFYKSA
jgi:hypothetical protein